MKHNVVIDNAANLNIFAYMTIQNLFGEMNNVPFCRFNETIESKLYVLAKKVTQTLNSASIIFSSL